MSVLDRIWSGLRTIIELESRVDRNTAQGEQHQELLINHEKRLIRLETTLDIYQRAAATPPRLPER